MHHHHNGDEAARSVAHVGASPPGNTSRFLAHSDGAPHGRQLRRSGSSAAAAAAARLANYTSDSTGQCISPLPPSGMSPTHPGSLPRSASFPSPTASTPRVASHAGSFPPPSASSMAPTAQTEAGGEAQPPRSVAGSPILAPSQGAFPSALHPHNHAGSPAGSPATSAAVKSPVRYLAAPGTALHQQSAPDSAAQDPARNAGPSGGGPEPGGSDGARHVAVLYEKGPIVPGNVLDLESSAAAAAAIANVLAAPTPAASRCVSPHEL